MSEDLVELAGLNRFGKPGSMKGKGLRRVATAQGAAYYGLPVGSIITADIIAAKKKENSAKGSLPEKGMTQKVGGKKPVKAGSSPQQPAAAPTPSSSTSKSAKTAPKKATDLAKTQLAKLSKASLKGPKKFKVGESEYSAPEGSRLIKSNKQDNFAYIVTPAGDVHAFTEKGEIEIAEPVKAALKNRFSGDLSGDTVYSEDKFDDSLSKDTANLDALKVGAVLESSDGQPVFSKQEDGTWEHSELGISLESKDIQSLYDSGELSLSESANEGTPAAEADLARMSLKEAEAYFNSLPEKEELYVNYVGGVQKFVKQKEGTWKSEDQEFSPISSTTLAFFKDKTQSAAPKGYTPWKPLSEPVPPIKKKEPAKQSVPDSTTEPKKDSAESPDSPALEDEFGPLNAPVPPIKKKTPTAEDKKTEDASSSPSDADTSSPKIKTSLDQWANEETEEWRALMKDPSAPSGIAGQAWATQKMQGLDKGPALASDDEFDALPGQPLYRGVSDAAQKDSFLAGDSFVGTGGNGSGLYFSTEKSHAAKYGNFSEDRIIEVKISPDAKIIDAKELETKRKQDFDQNHAAGNLLAAQLASGDLNTYASAIGVDGYSIEIEGVPSIVIANRSVLTARSSSKASASPKSDDKDSSPSTPPPSEPPTSPPVAEESPEAGPAKTPSAPEDELSADTVEPQVEAKNFANESGVKVGDSIPDQEFLTKAPKFTVFSYERNDGKKTSYTKVSDDELRTAKGTTVPIEAFKNSWKKMTVESYPTPTLPESSKADDSNVDAPNNAPTAPTSAPEASVSDTPIADAEKKHQFDGVADIAFSTDDIKAAITALESHSSFQVSYGLKSVPDNPVTQNKAALADAAKKAYPTLPAKPAFLNLLKKKVGVPIADAPEGNGPDISLGSRKPAKNAFGITGGSFKHSDVESALTLLKNFEGKTFKSHLAKNNNPLHVLDFNNLVGFNKDKLVTKAAVIKLLEAKLEKKNSQSSGAVEAPEPAADNVPETVNTSLEALIVELQTELNAPEVDEQKVQDILDSPEAPSALPDPTGIPEEDSALYAQATETPVTKLMPVEDIINAPMGTEVSMFSGTHIYRKTEEDHWIFNSTVPIAGVLSSTLEIAVTSKVLSQLAEIYDTYLKSSPGDNSSISDGTEDVPDDVVAYMPATEVNLQPVGTVFKDADGDLWQKTYQGLFTSQWSKLDKEKKVTALYKSWYKFESANSLFNFDNPEAVPVIYLPGKDDDDSPVPDDVPEYAQTPAAVADKTEIDTSSGDIVETGPDSNPSGLTPGKYTSTGKVFMYVKSDGTGVFVNSKGTVSKLSVAKVKANHAAGMNNYLGMPDDIPMVSGPSTTTPKIKAAPQEVVLPDGVYYLGSSSKANTTVYHVENGVVKIYTGGDTSADVEAVPLSKLKTNYFNGKIVDKDGISVVPVGHTGPVVFWNAPTSLSALKAIKTKLDSGEMSNPFYYKNIAEMKAEGFLLISTKLSEMIQSEGISFNLSDAMYQQSAGEAPHHKAAVKILSDKFGEMLEKSGADVSTPTSDTKALFTWDALGNAAYPEAAASFFQHSVTMTNMTDDVKTVTNLFQGAVGQVPMSLNHKKQWLKAFLVGDFKRMYTLEVDAASHKGKTLPKPYLHPGFPGNPDTHQIEWGPAVAGELPAGTVLPGTWSSESSQQSWSHEEVSNYLIAAHMKCPEQLSNIERRNWVAHHRKGEKKYVDLLSVKAKNRHDANQPPLTQKPEWSDSFPIVKSYTYLFESTEFPTNWSSSSVAAKDWIIDNVDTNPEIAPLLEKAGISTNPNDWSNSYAASNVLRDYFTAKQSAYEEELKKPVYKKIHTFKHATHDVDVLEDQFGNKKIFKATDGGDVYRAEVEVASNKLGKKFGFTTPNTEVMEFEGAVGMSQDFIENDGSLMLGGTHSHGHSKPPEELTVKQLSDVVKEHVLDWMLDNDDSHSDNFLLTKTGSAVGIDKGRSLYMYGNWNGLSMDYESESNAPIYFNKIYKSIQSGTLSKEEADAAYFAAMSAAKRVAKTSDADVAEIIKLGVANRTKWNPNGVVGKVSKKKVPNSANELVVAVLDRKNNIVADFEELWDRVYASSPYQKPELPPKALDDTHLVGWDDPAVISKAFDHKIWGAAPLHSSPDVSGGHSILWTEKNVSGADVVKGSFKVNPFVQKKVVSLIEAQEVEGVLPNAVLPTTVSNFPALGPWKADFTSAGKTVTKNAVSKEYDVEVIAKYQATEKIIDTDLEYFSVDLSPDDDGFITFPSGNKVPDSGLLQYGMALEHYKNMSGLVTKAIDEGTTTDKHAFTLFQPVPFHPSGVNYTTPNGVKYSQLVHGGYLKTEGKVTTPSVLPADAGQEGWIVESVAIEAPKATGVKYKKVTAVFNQSAFAEGGVKIETGGTYKEGSTGQEYEISLPTGEVIHFRNRTHTGTAWSQSGLLRFELAPDAEQSLARVEEFLTSSLGLDMRGVESKEDAETIYWREMFFRIFNSSDSTNLKVSTLKERLRDTFNKEVVNTSYTSYDTDVHVIEGISAMMKEKNENELEYWRDLAREHFGDQKVEAWIEDEKYLPQYQHLNPNDPEATTGKPFWNRIDVDTAALKAKGHLLALSTKSGEAGYDRYINSGGMLAIEERIRVHGTFIPGHSSPEDQASGAGNSVFLRVANGDALYGGSLGGAYAMYFSPDVMAQTGTYAYSSDKWGKFSDLNLNKTDPLKSLGHTGSGNEVMVNHSVSLFDYLEIMLFNTPSVRDATIKKMKALGFEKLRGVPIEERLVLRSDLNAAMARVKQEWK